MAGAIVIGVVARTGSAVAVALSGPAGAPRFWAWREIELVPPGLPAQPYHVAAGLDLAAAGQLISQVANGAEQAAAAGLRALADLLPAEAICVVAVMVKAVSVPDRLADVLRSHAWMHAAEGMLYRQAVLAAAQECGWRAHAVELPLRPAAEHALAALGQAAGRPWRRMEKDAARAAITVLAQTTDPALRASILVPHDHRHIMQSGRRLTDSVRGGVQVNRRPGTVSACGRGSMSSATLRTVAGCGDVRPRAWTGSPDNPSAASAIRAITRAIGAASACAGRDRVSRNA